MPSGRFWQKGRIGCTGHPGNGENVRSRIWAVATAVVLLASSAAIGGAGAAAAAPPVKESLSVTASSATDTPQVGSVTITYDVNQSARQITGVVVTLDGVGVPTTPLTSVTSKTSRGSVVLDGLEPGEYQVVVTVSNRKGDSANDATSFTITPDTSADPSAWCSSVSGTFSTTHTLPVGPGSVKAALWACLGANSDWVDNSNLGSSGEVYSTYCVPLGDPLQMRLYISQVPSSMLEDYSCVDMTSPDVVM